MVRREDVTRVMAVCEECGSVYAARQWPDGTIKVIGQDGCGCGSTAFTAVDATDEPDSRSSPETE